MHVTWLNWGGGGIDREGSTFHVTFIKNFKSLYCTRFLQIKITSNSQEKKRTNL